MPILDRFRLDGRVALVTGASSGLGAAFATRMAEAGADVVCCARRAKQLEVVASEVRATGRQAEAITVDVSDPDSCEAMISRALARFGRLDVVVNNAGVGNAAPATRQTVGEFRKTLDVNLAGVFWVARAAARVMERGGSIINIGSVLGLTTAGLTQAAYCASKAGLVGLTRDLAQEWTGRKGIRVNMLAPGFFATEMTARYEAGYLDGQVASRVPAGRLGELDECAAAVIFLASPASSYISGAVIPVDGGLLTT